MFRLHAARLSITPSTLRLPLCLLRLPHFSWMFHLQSSSFIHGFVCTASSSQIVVFICVTQISTDIFVAASETCFCRQTESNPPPHTHTFLWNDQSCMEKKILRLAAAVGTPVSHQWSRSIIKQSSLVNSVMERLSWQVLRSPQANISIRLLLYVTIPGLV